VAAIIGGTGIYDGARGEAVNVIKAPGVIDRVIHLLPVVASSIRARTTSRCAAAQPGAGAQEGLLPREAIAEDTDGVPHKRI
jgi:hypothetical protein